MSEIEEGDEKCVICGREFDPNEEFYLHDKTNDEWRCSDHKDIIVSTEIQKPLAV